jgi:mRNA degradation ribonuclease J1/J2
LYKKQYGTFEKYLKERWGYNPRRGQQLMKSAEFMQIAEKTMSQNANQNRELVRISEVILPKNEWQCRPLLEKLKHNGERIKVWCEVVGTGEKINAEDNFSDMLAKQ